MTRTHTAIPDFCQTIMDARTGGIFDDVGWMPIAEVQHAVRHIEADLRKAGIVAHEPVMVRTDGRAEDVASILAVLRAGGVAVPVHDRAHPDTLEHYRMATAARLCVGPARQEHRCLPDVHTIASKAPPDRPLLVGAGMITFTSGSTGIAKGVVLSGDRISAKLLAIRDMLAMRRAPEVIVPLQLQFSFGQWATFLPLMLGGIVHLSARFSAEGIMGKVGERPVTHLAAVPSMLRMLARGASLKQPLCILTGGEALSFPLKEALFRQWPDAEIFGIYGLTETGTCDLFRRDTAGALRPDSLGRPAHGIDVQIAAETAELLIRSPFQMLGYLDQPKLTAATLEDGWLHTGDLADIADDGQVELRGRLKELINRGGNKVSPLEIENIFAQHPGVDAALATGVPDARFGEAIHLLVVPSPGKSAPDATALLKWAGGKTERFKLPDQIHFGHEIPTGSTGKADRAALRRSIVKERAK